MPKLGMALNPDNPSLIRRQFVLDAVGLILSRATTHRMLVSAAEADVAEIGENSPLLPAFELANGLRNVLRESNSADRNMTAELTKRFPSLGRDVLKVIYQLRPIASPALARGQRRVATAPEVTLLGHATRFAFQTEALGGPAREARAGALPAWVVAIRQTVDLFPDVGTSLREFCEPSQLRKLMLPTTRQPLDDLLEGSDLLLVAAAARSNYYFEPNQLAAYHRVSVLLRDQADDIAKSLQQLTDAGETAKSFGRVRVLFPRTLGRTIQRSPHLASAVDKALRTSRRPLAIEAASYTDFDTQLGEQLDSLEIALDNFDNARSETEREQAGYFFDFMAESFVVALNSREAEVFNFIAITNQPSLHQELRAPSPDQMRLRSRLGAVIAATANQSIKNAVDLICLPTSDWKRQLYVLQAATDGHWPQADEEVSKLVSFLQADRNEIIRLQDETPTNELSAEAKEFEPSSDQRLLARLLGAASQHPKIAEALASIELGARREIDQAIDAVHDAIRGASADLPKATKVFMDLVLRREMFFANFLQATDGVPIGNPIFQTEEVALRSRIDELLIGSQIGRLVENLADPERPEWASLVYTVLDDMAARKNWLNLPNEDRTNFADRAANRRQLLQLQIAAHPKYAITLVLQGDKLRSANATTPEIARLQRDANNLAAIMRDAPEVAQTIREVLFPPAEAVAARLLVLEVAQVTESSASELFETLLAQSIFERRADIRLAASVLDGRVAPASRSSALVGPRATAFNADLIQRLRNAGHKSSEVGAEVFAVLNRAGSEISDRVSALNKLLASNPEQGNKGVERMVTLLFDALAANSDMLVPPTSDEKAQILEFASSGDRRRVLRSGSTGRSQILDALASLQAEVPELEGRVQALISDPASRFLGARQPQEPEL